MDWPFEFWPIDMPPGPAFLGVYLVMFLGAVSWGWVLGKALEPTQPAVPSQTSVRGSAYRDLSAGKTDVLGVGSFPRPEDRYLVAYLRNGREGLCETLLGAAIAHGILESHAVAPHGFVLAQPRMPLSGPLADFAREVEQAANLSSGAVRLAANRVVDQLAAQYEVRLDKNALLLPQAFSHTKAWILGACGSSVIAVGLLRLVRAALLRHSAGFLLIELVVSGWLLGAWTKRLATRREPNASGRRYLQWLA